MCIVIINYLSLSQFQHSGKDEGCLFRETHSSDNAYSEFQSIVNSTWYLGFNGRGQRLAGDQWTRRTRLRRCYQFTKTAFSYLSPSSPVGSSSTGSRRPVDTAATGPDVDFSRLISKLRSRGGSDVGHSKRTRPTWLMASLPRMSFTESCIVLILLLLCENCIK